jgi:hypothetical protein
MPADYDYLEEKVGILWSDGPEIYKPDNHSSSSIDGHTARCIFDIANEFLDDRDDAYSSANSLITERSAELSIQIEHLLDTMH